MALQDNIFFYHGRSMATTFRAGDCLVVEPVALADIRVGNVLVYHQADSPEKVVHRVVALVPGGVITRGDNNDRNDIAVVFEEHIIGRVTGFSRDGRTRRVRGGWGGLLRARLSFQCRMLAWFVWRHVRKLVFPLVRRPYRWLRQSGLVHYVWRPPITKIKVEMEGGPLVKYVSRGRTVVMLAPEAGHYWFVRPYDLIIPPPDDLSPASESRMKMRPSDDS